MDAGTTAAESSIPPQLEWKFSQVFGERAAGEEVQEGMGLLISYLGWFLVLLCEVGFLGDFMSAGAENLPSTSLPIYLLLIM